MTGKHWLVSLLAFALTVAAGRASSSKAGPLSMMVRAPGSIPAEGPCALEIRVTCVGENAVAFTSLDDDRFFRLAFQTPTGWKERERALADRLVRVCGRVHAITLRNGQSVSRTVYLHDYFRRIAPGRARLGVTLTIWPRGHAGKVPIVLAKTVALDVRETGPEGLSRRIEAIGSQIRVERKASRRMGLYASVTRLSHPTLIPVLIRALSDRQAISFHDTARFRLMTLCKTYGQEQAILDYVAQHGSRGDECFFWRWKEKGASLSRRQISVLSGAPSLWIRLYCLECFGEPGLGRGLYGSLKTEVKELTDRLNTLR